MLFFQNLVRCNDCKLPTSEYTNSLFYGLSNTFYSAKTRRDRQKLISNSSTPKNIFIKKCTFFRLASARPSISHRGISPEGASVLLPPVGKSVELINFSGPKRSFGWRDSTDCKHAWDEVKRQRRWESHRSLPFSIIRKKTCYSGL